ncbi:MAG: hypothetical protein EOS66_02300 [Mesorhizobium sp.]|nr:MULTISPECIES: hypothetical protein [unclassified Mesorhizobium]RWB62100.1 MAG: hypothetical protein EOQ48_11780 [Mesorhizobium sp.]RVC93867.1 hypothetical protein EN739_19535 [Mesorhizobium sp. M2A.F.Ca.ET.017.03.2.1]RWD75430.1 MAG: hypothetical protein EOS60_08970 [Mesorhizobium sp.]RWF60325.1 MAG: hypothetical protein EOS66_02300 [Mesorhizobium sp.]TIV86804.1 MAG: hypothetical protein E5V78_12425 [Mesorhizobium sp.]
MERGETFPNGIFNSSGFQGEGVECIASELLTKLRETRKSSTQSPKATGHSPRLSGEIANWVYILHAYCADEKSPAPAALLWLTFESLDLVENRPTAEFADKFKLPKVKHIHAFLEAAALDGEADANGKTLTLSDLERTLGVARQTLRDWRRMPQYRSRREFVAYIEGKSADTYRRRQLNREQQMALDGPETSGDQTT